MLSYNPTKLEEEKSKIQYKFHGKLFSESDNKLSHISMIKKKINRKIDPPIKFLDITRFFTIKILQKKKT